MNPRMMACSRCGAWFLPRSGVIARNRYCSNHCRGMAQIKHKPQEEIAEIILERVAG